MRGGVGGKLVSQEERNETGFWRWSPGTGTRISFMFPVWHASASTQVRSQLLTQKPFQRPWWPWGYKNDHSPVGLPEAHSLAGIKACEQTATARLLLLHRFAESTEETPRGHLFFLACWQETGFLQKKGALRQSLKECAEVGAAVSGDTGQKKVLSEARDSKLFLQGLTGNILSSIGQETKSRVKRRYVHQKKKK